MNVGFREVESMKDLRSEIYDLRNFRGVELIFKVKALQTGGD